MVVRLGPGSVSIEVPASSGDEADESLSVRVFLAPEKQHVLMEVSKPGNVPGFDIGANSYCQSSPAESSSGVAD